MAHFAKIDENNIVITVIVAEQDFIDSGAVGDPTKWIKTSYNTVAGKYYKPNSNWELHEDQSKAFRKNFASIGSTYDPELDAFIPRKPTASSKWTLDVETCMWVPPPQPDYVNLYYWDEDEDDWVKGESPNRRF